MLYHHALFKQSCLADFWQVMVHGLPLDFSVAGYFSAFPGILILTEIWYRGRITKWFYKGYTALAALIFSMTLGLPT